MMAGAHGPPFRRRPLSSGCKQPSGNGDQIRGPFGWGHDPLARGECTRSRLAFAAVTWINAVLVLAVAVPGVAIWSIKRHKDPHLEAKTEAA